MNSAKAVEWLVARERYLPCFEYEQQQDDQHTTSIHVNMCDD